MLKNIKEEPEMIKGFKCLLGHKTVVLKEYVDVYTWTKLERPVVCTRCGKTLIERTVGWVAKK